MGGPVDTHLFCWQVPLSQLAYGPSALPQILYNPAQQILAYTSFCPSPATLPTCSSYPLPLQVGLVLPGRSQWAHITGCSRPGQAWSDGTQMGVHGLPSPSLLRAAEPACTGQGWGPCEGGMADSPAPPVFQASFAGLALGIIQALSLFCPRPGPCDSSPQSPSQPPVACAQLSGDHGSSPSSHAYPQK